MYFFNTTSVYFFYLKPRVLLLLLNPVYFLNSTPLSFFYLKPRVLLLNSNPVYFLNPTPACTFWTHPVLFEVARLKAGHGAGGAGEPAADGAESFHGGPGKGLAKFFEWESFFQDWESFFQDWESCWEWANYGLGKLFPRMGKLLKGLKWASSSLDWESFSQQWESCLNWEKFLFWLRKLFLRTNGRAFRLGKFYRLRKLLLRQGKFLWSAKFF